MEGAPKVLNIAEAVKQQDIEDGGDWMQYSEGGEFLVAYALNKEFQRKLEFLTRRKRSQLGLSQKKDKALPQEVQDDIYCEAMAGTILRKWRNVSVDGSGAYEFNEENAKALLLKLRQLRIEISLFSVERESFHREQVEAASGN